MNKDRHMLCMAKCRSMILVARNLRFVRIFAGVPSTESAEIDSGVLENGDAQTFPSKFPTLSPHYYTVIRTLSSAF